MNIKLGKLPDERTVKVTIVLPAILRARLDRYARVFSQTWSQDVDASGLIPHILSQFLDNDRAFRKLESAPPAEPPNKFP